MKFFKKQKLALIIAAYWFLLIYIIAALVWWFIALNQQNKKMTDYKIELLQKADPAYTQKLNQIAREKDLRTSQYIGEGITFFIVILIGALFVYGEMRKQILFSRQQQNFMMAITHELKTPLAIILLNLETLQKRKPDEVHQTRLISAAASETTRLNNLINNILISSQLESGFYHITKQQINFSDLVSNTVDDFKLRYSDSDLQSQIEKDIYFKGDAILLQLLIQNLLENAYKYSDEKLISIKLNQHNNTNILELSDKGQGIALADKKKIFDKFYRAGNEITRSAKGTGLGLYLCKMIARYHRGKIAVTNNSPKGSIFTVTFKS